MESPFFDAGMRSITAWAWYALVLGALLITTTASAFVLPDPNADGLTVVSVSLVNGSSRLVDIVVRTAALSEPVHVAVYVPADYGSSPWSRYPVLYLLHGAIEKMDYAKPWYADRNAPAAVDASPFKGILVMPQCGRGCWYTDWQGPAHGGYKPQWESYIIKQLLPWVDANFRTLGTRDGRAIAGESMGGYGALALAARFPTLFASVGSFSGCNNIQDLVAQQILIANFETVLVGASYSSSETGYGWLLTDVQGLFGPYLSNGWTMHNPYVLAPVYGQYRIKLALYSGNGNDVNGSFIDPMESVMGSLNDAIHTRLNSSGSPHRYCHGNGTHTNPYWMGDLTDFLNYSYGETPNSCPNSWGAPQP